MLENRKNPKGFRYTGPESTIISALPNESLFKRKDGYFVANNEEILIKITEDTKQYFTPVTKTNIIDDNSGN
jgi:hypothetical protein